MFHLMKENLVSRSPRERDCFQMTDEQTPLQRTSEPGAKRLEKTSHDFSPAAEQRRVVIIDHSQETTVAMFPLCQENGKELI
jgi:hypothetical protein